MDLDKDYRIIQIDTDQSIGSNYTEVYSHSTTKNKSYLFSILFNLSSDRVLLRLALDNEYIINDLLLDNLTNNNIYRMPMLSDSGAPIPFPIQALSNTSYLLNFNNGLQYQNLSLSFKKSGSGNKSFKAGMATIYT